MVKIELKQEDKEDRIIVKALLNSKVIELVISSKFTKKYMFKKIKLDRSIYIMNVNGIFNHKWMIEHIYYSNYWLQRPIAVHFSKALSRAI